MPGYFMVRAGMAPGPGPWRVTGVVERLGTGEKRAFASALELASMIEEWSR